MASRPSPRGRVVSFPFVLAVVLLGLAAFLTAAVDLRQDKLALPLKKPLSALSTELLRPYTVADRLTLEPTVLEALGTRDYLHWRLLDTTIPATDPLAHPRLFVTYYSGGRNLVPHTPDECFLGAGYAATQYDNQELAVPSLEPQFTAVPVRVGTFARTAVFNREEVTVVYTFACNGRFAETRNGVRMLISDPLNYHAYFSKVEVHFPGASREQSVRGAAKLFNQVLPALLGDHWPDFEAAKRAVREAGATDAS